MNSLWRLLKHKIVIVNNFKSKLNRVKHLSLRIGKWLLWFFGLFSLILLVLSFTDIPYIAYHKLGTSQPALSVDPEIIVVLGGAGMPTPDGLIRTYYAAEAATEYQSARIIIALPYNEEDSLYQLNLMAHELIIRGIDSLRIFYEPQGYNTRSQVVNIGKMFNHKNDIPILIVTTPEHMYRSVKAFRKVGFYNVGGLPAFEKPVDEIKLYDVDQKESQNIALRYNMWSYLYYEILVLREYTAIFYYKLKGWI